MNTVFSPSELCRLALDSLDGLIYFSDGETYELLWCNSAVEAVFGPHWAGKKCYSYIHGRDRPCAHCPRLNPDSGGGVCREVYNSRVDRHYQSQIRCLEHEDRSLWVAVATDVSERRWKEELLAHTAQAHQAVAGFLTSLGAGGGFSLSVERLLAHTGELFQADRVDLFIFDDADGEKGTDDAESVNRHAWRAEGLPPLLTRLPLDDARAWIGAFGEARLVHPENPDEVAPGVAAALEERGVTRLVVAPLRSGGLLFGFLCVEHPRSALRHPQVLEIPARAIATACCTCASAGGPASLAQIDMQTGLRNRAAFLAARQRVLDTQAESLGLLLTAIWNPDVLADPESGDEVIGKIGRFLLEHFRADDTFHLEPGVFAILCPHIRGQTFLEKIRFMRARAEERFPDLLAFGHIWGLGPLDPVVLTEAAEHLLFMEKERHRRGAEHGRDLPPAPETGSWPDGTADAGPATDAGSTTPDDGASPCRIPGRHELYRRMEMSTGEAASEKMCVICLDIVCFHYINAIHGLEKGEEILDAVAHGVMRLFPDAPFGQLWGDVFALYVPDRMQARAIASLNAFFARPVCGQNLSVKIGVRTVDPAVPPSLLCDQAVMALRSVKKRQGRQVGYFRSEMSDRELRERALLLAAPKAVANGEFILYYQPKCLLSSGKIVGAEVLVRWQHEDRLVPPGEFIPLFERSGFITRLDHHVWDRAARFLARRREEGLPLLPLSVNVSRVDVENMDVCEVLTNIMQRYGLPHHLVQVEITESAYAEHFENVVALSDALREQGFVVQMDDFGCGYSSLNMLSDINIDILKTDLHFLDDNSVRGRGVLRTILRLSEWLDLPVVIEGVESAEQVDFLTGLGCMFGQGYFFYRPLPESRYIELLRTPEKIASSHELARTPEARRHLSISDLLAEGLHENAILDRIMGAVGCYSYENGRLLLLRANLAYFTLWNGIRTAADLPVDILEKIIPEDRPALLGGVKAVLLGNGDRSVQLRVRHVVPGGVMALRVFLFTVPASAERHLLYAVLNDDTPHMKEGAVPVFPKTS